MTEPIEVKGYFNLSDIKFAECKVCGKPLDLFLTLQFGANVCSVQCANRVALEKGITITFPDGSRIEIGPGGAEVSNVHDEFTLTFLDKTKVKIVRPGNDVQPDAVVES